MRKALMMIPLLFACAKAADAPPADPAPVTPPAVTEADVAGTWTGDALAEGSDSVIAKFTEICAAGSCKGIMEGSKDTIVSTYMLMADSVMGSSAAFMDPKMKARVIDHYLLHITGSSVTGTGHITLADKPDSVVARYRIRGTKAP